MSKNSYKQPRHFRRELIDNPRLSFRYWIDCTFKSTKKLHRDILDLLDIFTISSGYRLGNRKSTFGAEYGLRALVESAESIDFIVYLFGKHTINLPIFKKNYVLNFIHGLQ